MSIFQGLQSTKIKVSLFFIVFLMFSSNAKSQDANSDQSLSQNLSQSAYKVSEHEQVANACVDANGNESSAQSCSFEYVDASNLHVGTQSPCMKFEQCKNFCRTGISQAMIKSKKLFDDLKHSCAWGSDKIDVLGRLGEDQMRSQGRETRTEEKRESRNEELVESEDPSDEANEGSDTAVAGEDETFNPLVASIDDKHKAASSLKHRMAKLSGSDIDSELAKRKEEILKSDLSAEDKARFTKRIDDLSAIKAVKTKSSGGLSADERKQLALQITALDINMAKANGGNTNAEEMALFKIKLKKGIANGQLTGKEAEKLNQQAKDLESAEGALAEDGLTAEEVAEIEELKKDLKDDMRLKKHNQESIWTMIVNTQAQLNNMRSKKYLDNNSYSGLNDAVERVKDKFIALKSKKKTKALTQDQKLNFITKLLNIKQKANVIKGNKILAKK